MPEVCCQFSDVLYALEAGENEDKRVALCEPLINAYYYAQTGIKLDPKPLAVLTRKTISRVGDLDVGAYLGEQVSRAINSGLIKRRNPAPVDAQHARSTVPGLFASAR